MGTKERNTRVIFVIDDDRDDSEFLAEAVRIVLEDACEVRMFVDAETAMDAMAKETPDTVFLDLNLPKTPGDVALKRIKERPEMANVPVIVCSGSTYIIGDEEAVHSLAAHYLIKPSSLSGFTDMLRIVFSRAHGAFVIGEDHLAG